MHGPIRDGLEELLERGNLQVAGGKLADHLNHCDECSSELDAMREQSVRLGGLRAQETVEPSAGFYARVLQRIEERTNDSIWALFIESPFSKRLAVASLTIAIALGSYVIREENRERQPHIGGLLAADYLPSQTSGLHYDVLVMGSQSEQRDAVLVNFAEHKGEAQ